MGTAWPSKSKRSVCTCQIVVRGRWDTSKSPGARCVVNKGVTPQNHREQEGVSRGEWYNSPSGVLVFFASARYKVVKITRSYFEVVL
jgi:hypothetical protein